MGLNPNIGDLNEQSRAFRVHHYYDHNKLPFRKKKHRYSEPYSLLQSEFPGPFQVDHGWIIPQSPSPAVAPDQIQQLRVSLLVLFEGAVTGLGFRV